MPLPKWLSLKAQDIMNSEVLSVPATATAREIEQALVENGVSGLAVREEDGTIIGIISWRDVMDWFTDAGEPESQLPSEYYRQVDHWFEMRGGGIPRDDAVTAAELMNPDILSVKTTDDLRTIAGRMSCYRVHRMLVMNEHDVVVGVVSTLDILSAISEGHGTQPSERRLEGGETASAIAD